MRPILGGHYIVTNDIIISGGRPPPRGAGLLPPMVMSFLVLLARLKYIVVRYT